jgi:hypothetical protein
MLNNYYELQAISNKTELSENQKQNFLKTLRQKSLSANNRRTLIPEEYKNVKKVLPDLKKPKKKQTNI